MSITYKEENSLYITVFVKGYYGSKILVTKLPGVSWVGLLYRIKWIDKEKQPPQ